MKLFNLLNLTVIILFFQNVSYCQTQKNGYKDNDQNLNENYKNKYKWGILGGVAPFTKIEKLNSIIISEPFFFDYLLEQKKEPVLKNYFGGFFFEYFPDRFSDPKKKSRLAHYSEISFSKQGTYLNFENNLNNPDISRKFYYDMHFQYNYINMVYLMKFMPAINKDNNALKGIYLGIGPQVGIITNPENIIYNSWGPGKLPAFGTDLEQQQQLRNVLRGKTSFGFDLEIGYYLPWVSSVNIGIRYHHSVTDLIEVEPNSYNFKGGGNSGHVIQVGLRINLDGI